MMRVWEVLLSFLKLGVTSFGGPIAHVAAFQDEFVLSREWLDEERFTELLALCQALPGPTSCQLAIAIGYLRGGIAGAVAGGLGFALPAALLMVLLAFTVSEFTLSPRQGLFGGMLHGLQLAAVAVAARALWHMGRSLTPDYQRLTIAALATVMVLAFGGLTAHLAALLVGAGLGLGYLRGEPSSAGPAPIRRRVMVLATLALLVLLVLLVASLALVRSSDAVLLAAGVSFLRAGLLWFGGEHVLLPLLAGELLDTGYLATSQLVTGYGFAQALPGPLLGLGAYVGALAGIGGSAWAGGLAAMGALLLPSFLLVPTLMPAWERLQAMASVRACSAGLNAAAVGMLAAALFDPLLVSAVRSGPEMGVVAAAYAALAFWRWSTWAVVLGCALAAPVLGFLPV